MSDAIENEMYLLYASRIDADCGKLYAESKSPQNPEKVYDFDIMLLMKSIWLQQR
jgi:hypothetical protein